MGLYTKRDKQKDKYFKVVSIKKVIIKAKPFVKTFSFFVFIFQSFCDYQAKNLSIHNLLMFSFGWYFLFS